MTPAILRAAVRASPCWARPAPSTPRRLDEGVEQLWQGCAAAAVFFG
jgi:hypothetical protein